MATKNETQNVMEGMGAKGEREEGLLSVIQTKQTDSILEDSMLRVESSQSRLKACSSSESSLDNAQAHARTHTNLDG